MSEKSIIDVAPCKQFFINSLTKDITLLSCIYDLVDNAISGAEKVNSNNKMKDYSRFRINIDFEDKGFSISDNCGGIEFEHAKNYVFKFGNDPDTAEAYASSGYGIGMKRAFFKLGKQIQLTSCTRYNKIQVHIDVTKWMKEPGWNLEIRHDSGKFDKQGTIIKITELNSEPLTAFNKENFKRELLENLRKKYSKQLSNGLRIYVNNTQAIWNIKMLDKYYSGFYPIGDISVTIEIYKCIASDKDLGWYIFFNNLNVIKANKDSVTGWGEKEEIGCIDWDNEVFHGFYGIVQCESKNMMKLPLMTTKEINIETEFYRKLKEKMSVAVKECLKRFEVDGFETTIIQYKKSKREINKLKQILGVNSAAEVGRKTFDYYYENNL